MASLAKDLQTQQALIARLQANQTRTSHHRPSKTIIESLEEDDYEDDEELADGFVAIAFTGFSHALLSHANSPSNEQYWDTGASQNVSNNLTKLSDTRLLREPVPLGGIGSGVTLTHVGFHSDLPTGMQKCYFSKDLRVTLFSLGYCSTRGATWFGNKHGLVIYDHESNVRHSHLHPLCEQFVPCCPCCKRY